MGDDTMTPCFLCGKPGHWEKDCHERQMQAKDKEIARLRAEVDRLRDEVIEPDYGIVYYPPGVDMRHTSWLKWAAKGKPPEDFGKIVKVFRTPPRAIDDLP